MNTMLTFLRKEWIEQARTSRLIILGVVLVFFGLSSPLFAKFTPQILALVPGGEQFAGLVPAPTVTDAITQYVKNINQFSLFLAILLTMGMVAQEKEKGTAAMMLVKPVSRTAFLLAKFVSLSLTFLAAMLVSGLAAYYYTVLLFSTPDLGAWLGLTVLMWVYAVVIIAITLLFSTLFRSQAAAGGLSFGVMLLLSVIGGLPTLGEYMPGYVVSWGASFFTPNPVNGWPALGVSLVVIAACLIAAATRFNRQEL